MGGRGGTSAGFTLIETLVAMVAFGLLLAGLTQGVRYGVRAWGAQSRALAEDDQVDAVDGVLRHLIGNMVRAGSALHQPMTAREDRFEFATVMPEAGARGVRRADVALFVDRGHQFVLRWVPYVHQTRLTAAAAAGEAPLLSGVERVVFAYHQGTDAEGGTWQTVWKNVMPPDLVRIRLVFPAGDPRHWPDIVVGRILDGE